MKKIIKTKNINIGNIQKAIIGISATLACVIFISSAIAFEATGFAISAASIFVGSIIGNVIGKSLDHKAEGASIGALIGSIYGIALSSDRHKKNKDAGISNDDPNKAFDCMSKDGFDKLKKSADCLSGNLVDCIELAKVPCEVASCMGETNSDHSGAI